MDGPEQTLRIAALESKLKHTQARKDCVDCMDPAWLCRQDPDREVEISRLILRWCCVLHLYIDIFVKSIQSSFSVAIYYLCVLYSPVALAF